MTDTPKRGRGRPRKEAAPEPVASCDFLEERLSRPSEPTRKAELVPDEDTIRTIFELAKLFATRDEIAGVLGVSRRTLYRFLEEHEKAKDALDDGMQHAKISLRRKQLALADKNAPAAIFLGKNYLGQKDEHHTTSTTAKPAKEMNEAELMEIAEKGVSQKGLRVVK